MGKAKEYPVVKVTKAEIRMMLKLYGWSGMWGNMKRILAKRGLDWGLTTRKGAILCVRTWWEDDNLYHQNYEVEDDPHNAQKRTTKKDMGYE